MIEMLKIIKGVDKIVVVQHFSTTDGVRTRDHRLRVKKTRVRTVLRQGSFSRRVVNAWNGLPGKVVTVEGVDKFKWDLDRYLDDMRWR